MFKVALLNNKAIVPRRANTGDAGMDVSSVVDVVVPPRGQAMVSTGISIQIPMDCYARIAPRSGLAAKHGIDVGAGVVDSSYRGEIKVILFNHTDEHFEVKVGDRIAQLVFERIYVPHDLKVVPYESLLESDRGVDGFGSTGVRLPTGERIAIS